MYEEIVGLIAVMLIVYLFIMVLRPERKFDRLFQNDSDADVRRSFGGGENIYDRTALLDPKSGKTNRSRRYTGSSERADVSSS